MIKGDEDDVSLIVPGLYVSNAEHALKYGHKYSLVVNCTPDIGYADNVKNKIRIPVWDRREEVSNLYSYLLKTQALEEIHEHRTHNGGVLIHCAQGIQRSAAVTGCYMIRYIGCTVPMAISRVQTARPNAFKPFVNFEDAMYACYANNLL
jgi:protein-tyrosine phosphatase